MPVLMCLTIYHLTLQRVMSLGIVTLHFVGDDGFLQDVGDEVGPVAPFIVGCGVDLCQQLFRHENVTVVFSGDRAGFGFFMMISFATIITKVRPCVAG